MKTKAKLYSTILLSFLYAQVDYSTEIQPIFNNSCTSCHQYGHNSGLNLTTYSTTMTGGNSGMIIVAGDHANSELYNRITLPESAQGDMPPSGSLSQSDIDLIANWIDEGALEVPAIEVDTPDVVINEFLAGSENCCGSDIFDGNTEDFVELYNYGTELININGWGFSDTDGLITTIAPDTSINPGDFLVLWYTGDNNGFPEINEKLSKDGETIYIADADGNPMISYDFGPQTDDVSYGRNPDGSETWEYFSIPTPGTTNGTTNSTEFQPQTNEELEIAVDMWISDNDSALSAYGEINTWDISLITDMSYLFQGASSFNGDISTWDVSSVIDMSGMFWQAYDFNQDLSTWDVSSVTNMNGMFRSASSFNQDLSDWNISNVTDIEAMFFYATSFNQDLPGWDVSGLTNLSGMFREASSFNGDISSWNVSNITNMARLFYGASSFNRDISNWNVSNVTDMTYIFSNASSFNRDISNWNVSSVTTMYGMFFLATSVNQDISSWDVSSVTNMNVMFQGASSFNGDLSSWDVSSVTNMSGMLRQTDSFNQDLSSWDVSSVLNMSHMFKETVNFNQDLSNWDVSNVTNMKHMFSASNFNGDISGWNVSSVTDAGEMFTDAASFNQDLTSWDVTSMINMSYMFLRASNFNGDISSWNVSNVLGMNGMFQGASSFNRDISSWNVSNVEGMYAMFDGTDALSDENKCAIHNSWSVQSNEWTYDWSTSCALTTYVNSLVPDNFSLHQNYPNPFNPVTTLRYELPEDALVNISIYDMMGGVVKTLINDQQTAGYRSAQWNATNNAGSPVSAGIYLYMIQAGEFRQTKKMVLLK